MLLERFDMWLGLSAVGCMVGLIQIESLQKHMCKVAFCGRAVGKSARTVLGVSTGWLCNRGGGCGDLLRMLRNGRSHSYGTIDLEEIYVEKPGVDGRLLILDKIPFKTADQFFYEFAGVRGWPSLF